jgi:hypothetical protein
MGSAVSSPSTTSQEARRLELLAAVAIVGHVFSTAIAWLLPFFSEYTLIGDNISELAIGSYGYLQTAAFLAAGWALWPSLGACVGPRVVRGARG